jgi:hypothetical protein
VVTARRTRSNLLAIAPLLALGLAGTADAGQLKCSSHRLASADYAALKREARRAFGVHAIDWKSLHACMNPGKGRTWLQGVPEPQPDGTVYEPGATCMRDSGRWRCEVDVARRLLVTTDVGGSPRSFDLHLPLTWAVEDARRLLFRTIDLARKLSHQPICGAPAGQAPGVAADELNWEAEVRQMPPETPVESAIYEEDGTTSVSLNGLQFDFAGTVGDVDAREFRCWGEIVIVT